MRMTRRSVMTAGAVGVAGMATTTGAGAAPVDGLPLEPGAIAKDLERYLSFGSKRSGGAGDEACGAWLEARLKAAGLTPQRHAIETPFIENETCRLTLASGAVVPLLAQAPWRLTPAAGLEGRLFSPAEGGPAVPGGIAVAALSHRRWSSSSHAEVVAAMSAAQAAGAGALILITNGPSGEALALNAPPVLPSEGQPSLAILAPHDAGPVLEALQQGQTARFLLTGETGLRPAWNLIGRLDRGRGRWLVLSTPRSGWFTCGGERGPGVAVWLALVAWAAREMTDHDLAVIATSGHEFENHGGHQALTQVMPSPERTALWFHLGANVAARDWHEAGGELGPLPSADPQRFLVASQALLPAAKAAFAGQPGLEQPYPDSRGAAGELGEILKAGYPSAAGIFGGHRLHHAAIDDERALHPPLVEEAAIGAARFVRAALA